MTDAIELAAIIRELVQREAAEMRQSIDAAISQRFAAMPKPENGKDVDPLAIREMVREAVEAIPKPKDGESVDPAAVEAMVGRAAAALPKPKDGNSISEADVKAMVEHAVAAIPKPRDGDHGKSVELSEITPLLERLVKQHVEALPKPKDGDPGKSVDPVALATMIVEGAAKAVAAMPKPRDGDDGDTPTPEQIAPLVRAEVERVLAHWPKPKDGDPGQSVTLEQVEPLIVAQIAPLLARAVEALPKAKDGISPDAKAIAAEVLETVKLGIRQPKDGKSVTIEDVTPILEAAVAKHLLDLERRGMETVQRALDKIEAPKDGRDGFDLEAFDMELADDDRTLRFTFVDGGKTFTKELRAPWPLYRDVYKPGEYQKGDCVTYGGSQWIAKRDTNQGIPGDDWRLAVKRGQDAK